MIRPIQALAAGTAALLLIAGCTDSAGTAGGGSGQLVVRLTDAPVDHVASATIWVSSAYIIGGDDSTGNRFVLLDTAAEYDVMTLTDGVTALLGTATLPSGSYTQMRLIVDSARVTLDSGFTFSDGASSKSMKTPSAHQTGIKVNFAGPVNISSGQTLLVVDFDVSRNFVFTGPRTAPHGVLFKPVLHATVVDQAGSIAGTVLPDSAGARIYAILGPDTVTSALADSVGAYKLWFLPPGSYAVAAAATGFVSQTDSVTVAAGQHVTGVNFTLVP